ncbi:MAG TPA: cellulase family glycosylhydrolase [Candidatus Limnocylindrales bacterium]|nr:cellulase family glycosylhydrolase [Candidatus Limnocylindrales bacterium]
MTERTHSPRWRRGRWLIAAGALVLALAGLLALDLANRGLTWQVFWSLTGEEAPVAQLRGMVELAGNATRRTPDTAPYIPIAHASASPFGINTFLEQEAEPAKREQIVAMIADAGFTWMRQQFVWEDIEIHGRGDFTDRRNDSNGVDAWAKYDQIVDLAQQYGVGLIARLDNPPAWAQSVPGNFAPPADVQDFVNYAVAVAQRYKGRIDTYQVWNEPNIYPEWGEQAVNPEAYSDLLCRTYDALKAVDPNITVLSGALSPTVALTGRDLSDLIYLQRMYDAGAGACFDVLAAQGYGFFSGPTDRRLRPFTLNFGRPQYLRDTMVANGDAAKSVWITEAAWNPVDSPEVPVDVAGRENYGVATREQAAAYMPLAYQRAQEEWPWMGVISYWFFKRPSEAEAGQSWYYFRMVEPDFTPLPVYNAMRDYLTTLEPTLYRGVHQAEHWAVTLSDDAALEPAEGAQLGEAERTASAQFTVQGTSVMLRWRGDALLTVTVDSGSASTVMPNTDGWTETLIASSLFNQRHTVEVSSAAPFLLDSITITAITIDDGLAAIGLILSAAAVISLALLGLGLWRAGRRRSA